MQHNIKNFLALITFVLGLAAVQAQAPGQGAGHPEMAAQSTGHIFGKIVDSTGKALGDVSVMLLQIKVDAATQKSKEVLLKGATTQSNGDFSFEDVPLRSQFKLKISSTGFKATEQVVSFRTSESAKPASGTGKPNFNAAPEKDLGKIKLFAAINQLQGVTVTTTAKPLMRLDVDKKVFNVEQNLVSSGGTAVDVMKNVPSLSVDIDGNVTMRNSSPQIFVDGRPTTLTLDEIPANAIESVEVISNPSAKYDASGGGAGILNIVLKKNKKTGYNGNIRVGVNKYGAGDIGSDFNVRQGKLNFNASVNARSASGRTYSNIDRLTTDQSPAVSTNQASTEKQTGAMLFGRAGLDYFVTNKTTLSLSAVRMHGSMQPTSVLNINTDSLYSAGTTNSFSQRYTNTSRTFDRFGVVFGMKHLFAKEGEELTFDANYMTGQNRNNATYNTDYYSKGLSSSILNSQLQQIIGGGNDKNLVLQTDYVKPFTSNLKLEAGLRASLRSRVNTNGNYIFDNISNEYILLPSAASNYNSNDNVYAAYATITGSKNNFGYKIGLRAESSNYTGELIDTKETFSNKYPVSLFPSIFLSQKLGNNQELQLSYTRRVNRPNFFQLIPFVDSTDKLNITQGNPALKPEFTQSLELNYLKQFNRNNTFLASLYYRKTDNLITNYLTEQTNTITGGTYLVNTFINANSSYSAGAELTLQNSIAKWWTLSTDLNLYQSKINTSNVTTVQQDALFSWFAKLNSTFKLPANFSLQLTPMYQSKTNLPVNTNTQNAGGPPGMMAQSSSQGYIKPFYSVDLALRKSFMNNKASVTLSVNDIFRSRQQIQYSYSDYFEQTYTRLKDPQMVRLNFTYNFGKIDALLFKRKSQGTGQSATDTMQ